MCLFDLYTVIRGLSGVPWIFLRMLAFLFSRLRVLSMIFFMASSLLDPRLADLAAHVLVLVLDPLAFVGLHGAERADLGGDLPDLLPSVPFTVIFMFWSTSIVIPSGIGYSIGVE